ncbi:hypothetical protein B0H19DRAFT_1181079 [Mycena capillaripes]|nr:hypothetical protein B0H19DRAFT_1181079 [Mycena capillaripes]
MASSTHYEIYRASPLGIALMDTIDEYVRSNVLSGTQGISILQQFDRAMADALATKVKAKASVKARLKTYNDYQEVWTFFLRNATFTMDDKTMVTTERVKVVACKGDVTPAAGASQPSPKKQSGSRARA